MSTPCVKASFGGCPGDVSDKPLFSLTNPGPSTGFVPPPPKPRASRALLPAGVGRVLSAMGAPAAGSPALCPAPCPLATAVSPEASFWLRSQDRHPPSLLPQWIGRNKSPTLLFLFTTKMVQGQKGGKQHLQERNCKRIGMDRDGPRKAN